MKKLKSFAVSTTAGKLLEELKEVNFMRNKKKLKVKKVRTKKEIIKPKVLYPSLSENYEEDLERNFKNLNYDNKLIDIAEQLLFDQAFDRALKWFFIGLFVLIVGLILIFK